MHHRTMDNFQHSANKSMQQVSDKRTPPEISLKPLNQEEFELKLSELRFWSTVMGEEKHWDMPSQESFWLEFDNSWPRPSISTCSLSTLSPVDTQTPVQLRVIPFVITPEGSPPPTSHIPVPAFGPSSRRTRAIIQHRMQQSQAVTVTGNQTASRCTVLKRNGAFKDEVIQPLDRLMESVDLFIQQFNSDEWEKKKDGLTSIGAPEGSPPPTPHIPLHLIGCHPCRSFIPHRIQQSQTFAATANQTASRCMVLKRNDAFIDEVIQPLDRLIESVDLFSQQFNSDEWEKKKDGLTLIGAPEGSPPPTPHIPLPPIGCRPSRSFIPRRIQQCQTVAATRQQTDSGNRLQNATEKTEAALHRQGHPRNGTLPPLQPQVTREETKSAKPLRPTPRAAMRPDRSKVSHPGMSLHPAKTNSSKGNQTASRCTVLKRNDAFTDDEVIQPLGRPAESLSLIFQQLNSDEWERKKDGLTSIRALARHHPKILSTKLHVVCGKVIHQVSCLNSAVAIVAMKTLCDLYVHLGKAMDLEAESTASALLLQVGQARTKTETLQANLALDALINHCSPGRVLSALLNTGLSHSSALVRGSTAQHLCQLVDILGGDQVLSSVKPLRCQIIQAACAMALDGAMEVRKYGREMLRIFSPNDSFLKQWKNLVPNKDLHRLQKILQKF